MKTGAGSPTIPMTSLMNDDDSNMEAISVGDFYDREKDETG